MWWLQGCLVMIQKTFSDKSVLHGCLVMIQKTFSNKSM